MPIASPLDLASGLGKRSPTAGGHFVFMLDGSPVPGYVRSVEGGTLVGEVIDETVGPDFATFKHLGTLSVEPLTLELGMSMSRPVFEWIQASWRREFTRKNGAVVHADARYRAQLEQSFIDALIAETTFPTLDGSSTDPAYLTVKLQAESVDLERAGEESVSGVISRRQKQWSPSNFRLHLDGIDTTHVAKIDSFSVKQKLKELRVGPARLPELEPTNLEFDNLTVYTTLNHADDFIAWYEDAVVKGDKETRQERTGAIEFVSPDGVDTLFTVTLKNVGIYGLSIDKSEAGSEQVKRCKVNLYVEAMDLEYGDGID